MSGFATIRQGEQPPFGEPFLIPRVDPALGVHAVIVRAADLSDTEVTAIVELLRTAFDGGPHWFDHEVPPADHFLWKFRDSPEPGQCFLTMRDGEIVGLLASSLRRTRLSGQPRMINESGDVAMRPDLQGSGTHTPSLQFRDTHPPAGLDLKLGIYTHPAHLRHIGPGGYREPVANALRLLARPLDVGRLAALEAGRGRGGESRTAATLRPGWKRWLGRRPALRSLDWRRRQLANALRRPTGPSNRRGDWNISTIGSFDERFDDLFERAAESFDYLRVRDAAYLNWRFGDPRSGPFEVRVAERGPEVLGYAALAPSSGYIADLLVLPGREDVVASLVADATERVAGAGAPVVQTWLPSHHPYRAMLHHLGFVTARAGQAPLLAVRAIAIDDAELQPFRDPRGRIHFMPADSDHV